MQRLSTGLIATFTALTISLPLKAETDPCSRVYNAASSVMSARQNEVLLPEVLEKTNLLIDALDRKQRADVSNVVREMIVGAYKVKLGVFPSHSAIDEFANSYALRCIEEKDNRLVNIEWDTRTVDAVADWTDSLESVKQTTELEEAFQRAEAGARALREIKQRTS